MLGTRGFGNGFYFTTECKMKLDKNPKVLNNVGIDIQM
jgi:hypothetical protein